MKRKKMLSILLCPALAMAGFGTITVLASQDTAASPQTSAADTSEMFSDRDYEVGYDETACARIQLNETTASCTSDTVEISGSTVTIREEGTYILTGSLDDGMIIVNGEKTDKIRLILDNVSINSQTCAAIYILQADKVFLTQADGSENTLSNGGEFIQIDDNHIDAVLFSKEDLTLNGTGTLTIESPGGHGIVSKDDLVFTGGSYVIHAGSHGLSSKDNLCIADGSFTIEAGKDGLHSDNSEDTALGNVYAAGGDFSINAQGDGISASGYLQLDQGTFHIQAGGGSEKADAHTREFPGAPSSSTQEDTDSTSTKGIKAGGALILNDGTYEIDSADDSLHTNDSMTVNQGIYQLSTGDDGFHADSHLFITGGTIDISECYEGIEGLTIEISGGDISLTASDDGLNAAGGNDQSGMMGFGGGDFFAADPDAYIRITGGTLFIDASGDGIDSNGDLYVSGGEIYVAGPTSGADGPLDYDGEAQITDGTIIAAGSAAMAQNFGSASAQGSMLVTVESQPADSLIELKDSDGQVLVSWTSPKAYESVLISCPNIVQGSVYTLTAGSSETEITMDSLIYGSGGMGGGMGSGMGKPGGGNRFGGMDGTGEFARPQDPGADGQGRFPGNGEEFPKPGSMGEDASDGQL